MEAEKKVNLVYDIDLNIYLFYHVLQIIYILFSLSQFVRSKTENYAKVLHYKSKETTICLGSFQWARRFPGIILFNPTTIIFISQVTKLRHVKFKKNIHVIQLPNGRIKI